MVLPTALVVGPMKCGTSWIHDYLLSRGDVCLPAQVKETFFFDRYQSRGIDWYAKHFGRYDARLHECIVEVAPSLFHAPEAPKRILDALGEIPLIITTRDPLKRAWSHYQHLRRKGYTAAPLHVAARDFPEIIEASRYDIHISRWTKALPNATFTVLPLEDLELKPDDYVLALCNGLKISYKPVPLNLSRPFGGAGVPTSLTLARIGRSTATALRSVGAYGLVNVAKKAGLRRVFFGGAATPDARPLPSEDEMRFLKENLQILD